MLHLEAVPDGDEEQKPPVQEDVVPIYTQPSTRVLLTWTPVQVRTAESSAENGQLSFAAELVDNLLADETIGGAIETRTGGLQGLPLFFEDGRGGEAGESPLSAELTDDWWRSYPETELKQLSAWGIMLGVGFAEQVWEINEDGRFAPHLRHWHPKNFTWNSQIHRWTVRTAEQDVVVIEPDDPKWIVYTPYGSSRPWARGLWRGLARWWMLKSYAISDWGLHGEQASRLVVTSESKDQRATPSTHAQRKEMSADLQSLGKDGVIALPDNFDVKLLEATANTRDIYGAQVEATNEACVIAINGQNLTTSVKGGSLAAANVHERVEARRLRSDGVTISNTIRKQSLVWWTLWNFGQTAVAPWPRWETDPPEDMANKAAVFSTTAEALVKLKAAGLEVSDLEKLSQDYGIPELQARETDDGEGSAPGDPAGGDGTGDAGGDPGGTGADPSGGNSGQPEARLASGLPMSAAKGFADGQSWADSAADHGARLQAKDNRDTGFIDRLTVALEQENYAAIEAAVLGVFDDEPAPKDVAELIANLFVMSQRAGQAAVDQDV